MWSVSALPDVTCGCAAGFPSLPDVWLPAETFSVLQGLTASRAYGNSLTTAVLPWSIPPPKASSHP